MDFTEWNQQDQQEKAVTVTRCKPGNETAFFQTRSAVYSQLQIKVWLCRNQMITLILLYKCQYLSCFWVMLMRIHTSAGIWRWDSTMGVAWSWLRFLQTRAQVYQLESKPLWRRYPVKQNHIMPSALPSQNLWWLSGQQLWQWNRGNKTLAKDVGILLKVTKVLLEKSVTWK